MRGEANATADPDAEADPPEAIELPRPHSGAPRASQRRDRWPYWVAVSVLIVGLLATGALVWVSAAQYSNNEKRLLDLRVRELGAVLTQALPNIQTPLASAAALADATAGDPAKFTRYLARYARAGRGQVFISVSLWRLRSRRPQPITVVGEPPQLATSPASVKALFARATSTRKLTVIGLTQPNLTRLGYAITSPALPSRYVVYAESPLPHDRRSTLQSNAAFSELNYAIYLGASENPANLLVTSLSRLPAPGRQGRLAIPFGDTVLTMVVSARQPLGGTLPQRLPWIIAIVGALLALGAAALTSRLISGRRSAEHLARQLEQALRENQRLFNEQRTIAQTLQQALLPHELPSVPGAETGARFEPGERGIEIGGDWYDVIPQDGEQLLVVVGDVSGRGLPAASTMASLRYAIHAYAAQKDPPATILGKLSRLLSVTTTGQFATVLCALVDVRAHEVTMANAGHLPPLLISGDRGRYLECEVGFPIGVEQGAVYGSTTVSVPAASTFLAFTDGLVERRGENLDRGLERLREAALADRDGLPELLGRLLRELDVGASDDDTAIVGVRWTD